MQRNTNRAPDGTEESEDTPPNGRARKWLRVAQQVVEIGQSIAFRPVTLALLGAAVASGKG
jgi:hypothetical protein